MVKAKNKNPAIKKVTGESRSGNSKKTSAVKSANLILQVKNGRAIKKVGQVAKKARNRIRENRDSSPHRTLRFTRRSETRHYDKTPSSFKLARLTVKLLQKERGKFLSMILIFAPLTWLLTGIFSQGGFVAMKELLGAFDKNYFSWPEETFALFVGFVTEQTRSLPGDSLLILNILVLILWLSSVWIARHSFAGKATRLREAFYTSGVAIVPFLLLLILLVVQLLPAIFGAIIFISVQGGGFTKTNLEVALFVILAILLVVLSLYFMISTLIALQVVTLPGMFPWRALRNARKLVMNRRFAVLRKLIVLPVLLIILWGAVFIPLLALDNAVCSKSACLWSTFTLLPIAYYMLLGFSLVFISTYLYVLYRALIEQEDNYI
jgi:hypothetical protein